MSESADSIQRVYDLLPAQREFLHPNRDVALAVDLYQGGFGSGKTFSGALRGILLAGKYPGSLGLVCAKTYPMVRDTTMRMYFQLLGAMGFIKEVHYTFNKSESTIKFLCYGGSEVIFRHLEDSEKIKSLNLTWAHVEEMSQITESDFLMLLSRLRQGVRNYLFGTSNPQASKGWMYKYFVEKNKGRIEKEGAVIEFRRIVAPSTQNIHLPAAYLENMKSQYDPEYYAINVLGQDGDYTEGLVVKHWSIANEDETVVYEPDKRIILTCDFNIDPNSWAIGHRDIGPNRLTEWRFFDEICMQGATVETAEEFARRYAGHEAGIIITGDASGDNRSTQSAKCNETNYTIIRNVLSQHGFRNVALNVPTYNPPPISRVQSWNAMVRSETGDVRIRINPTKCKWLKWNMENLKYIEGTNVIYEPSRNELKKDVSSTLKYTKHIFDAASYAVAKFDPIKRTDTETNKGGNVIQVPYRPSSRYYG